MEEERLKKLKAGKEKLAAFQKKRAKKKKKRTVSLVEGGEESDSRNSLSSIDTAEFSSETQSIPYDSDHQGLTSGDESANEEQEHGGGFEAARHELRFAAERIAELEESLMGKQLALDTLVRENDRLKLVASDTAQNQIIVERPVFQGETTEETGSDGHDELSSPENRDSYSSETHQLLQQVQLLQMQLQQAGQTLHLQMSQHQFSAQALLDAKNQMLGLQDKLNQKDRRILQLESQISDQCSNCSSLELRLSEKDQRITQLEVEISEGSGHRLSLEGQLDSAKQRERESSEVVKQLMVDVETLQKGGAQRSVLPGQDQLGNISEAELSRQMEQLRNELDEMYGNQIVHMKEELCSRHDAEVNQLRVELQKLEKSEVQLVQFEELESLRQENAEYQQQIQEVTSQLVFQQQNMDVVTSELTQTLKEKEVSLSLVERLECELKSYKEEALSYQRRICDLDVELQSLQSQLNNASELTEANSQHFSAFKAEGATPEATTTEKISVDSLPINYVIENEQLLTENRTLRQLIASQETEIEQLKSTDNKSDGNDSSLATVPEDIIQCLNTEVQPETESESDTHQHCALVSAEVIMAPDDTCDSDLESIPHSQSGLHQKLSVTAEDSGIDFRTDTMLSLEQSELCGGQSESRTVVLECHPPVELTVETGCENSAQLVSAEVECEETDVFVSNLEEYYEAPASGNEADLHERFQLLVEENRALKHKLTQLHERSPTLGPNNFSGGMHAQSFNDGNSEGILASDKQSSTAAIDDNNGSVDFPIQSHDLADSDSSIGSLKEKLYTKIENLLAEKAHWDSSVSELQSENKRLQSTLEEYQIEVRALQEGREELRRLTSDLDVLIHENESHRMEAEGVSLLLHEKRAQLEESKTKLAQSEDVIMQLTQSCEDSELARKSALQQVEVLQSQVEVLKQKTESSHQQSFGEDVSSIHMEYLEAASESFSQDVSGVDNKLCEVIEVSVTNSDSVNSMNNLETYVSEMKVKSKESISSVETPPTGYASEMLVDSVSPIKQLYSEKSSSANNEHSTSKTDVISDIELRLNELEALNTQLKSEKEQLLHDFEKLTNNLETLKLAEEEKDCEREKLQEQFECLEVKADRLTSSLEEKDAELEKLKLQMSSTAEDRICQIETLTRKLTDTEKERDLTLNQLNKYKCDLDQIQALVLSDSGAIKDPSESTKEPSESTKEPSELCDTIRLTVAGKSEEVIALREENTKIHNLMCELEKQVENLKSEATSTDVQREYDEFTTRIDHLLTENGSLVAEKESVTADLVKLQDELSELQNELRELRYESETMQSLMTDMNREKEDLAKSRERLEISVEESEGNIHTLQYQLSEARNENIVLKESLRAKEVDMEKYEADCSVLQESLSTAEDEIDELKLKHADFESAVKTEREIYQNNSDSDLQSLVQVSHDKLSLVETFISKIMDTSMAVDAIQSVEKLSDTLENIHEQWSVLNSKADLVSELESCKSHLTNDLEQSQEKFVQLSQQLEEVRESHNNLEKQIENNKAEEVNENLNKLEEEKGQLEVELRMLTENLATSRQTLEEVQSELNTCQKQTVTFTKNIDTLQHEKEMLIMEMSDIEINLEQMERSNHILNDSLKASVINHSELTKQMAGSQAEKEKLANDLNLAKTQVQLLREDLTQNEAEMSELSQRLSKVEAEKQTECERLTQCLAEMGEKLDTAEKDAEGLRKKISDISQQLETSVEEKKSIEERNEILQSELLEGTDNVSSAQERNEALQRELLEGRSNLSDVQERNEALQTELLEGKSNLSAAQERNEALQSELLKANSDLSAAEKRNEGLQNDLLAAKRDLSAAQENLELVQNELFQQHKECSDQVEKLESMVLEMSGLQQELEESRKLVSESHQQHGDKLEALSMDVDRLQSENDSLKNSQAVNKSQLNNLQSKLESLTNERDRFATSFNDEKEVNAALSGELQAVKQLADELKSAKDKANYNLVTLEKQHSDLKNSLEEEQALSKSLRTELDQHRHHLSQLQTEQEKMTQSIADVEVHHVADVAKLQAQLDASSGLEEEKEEIVEELMFLRNENQKLSSNSQSLMNELEFCRSQHSVVLDSIQLEFEKQSHVLLDYESQLAASKQECIDLNSKAEKQSEELQTCKTEHEKQLKTLENNNMHLKTELEGVNEQLLKAINCGKFFEDQILSYESQIELLNSTAEALRRDKNQLSEDLEISKDNYSNLQEKYQHLSEKNNVAAEESNKLEKDLENLQFQMSNLEIEKTKEKDLLERNLQLLNEENSTLQSQLEKLMTSKALTEENNQELKMQILVDTDRCTSGLSHDWENAEQGTQTDLHQNLDAQKTEAYLSELESLKEERDKLREENNAAEDQFQKLLAEYQSDVEALKSDVQEKTLRENSVCDELEIATQRLKSVEKENKKLQDMYQALAGTAVQLGMLPDDTSSQASTEVEEMGSEDGDGEVDTDENPEMLDTIKMADSTFMQSDDRVVTSEPKQASVEVDKMSLSESMQEEDAEIQAQYKAMLQESAPHKVSSGITYTEEEYEEKLKSLAEKFEQELQSKEEFIRDQHAVEMERMRIEMEYDLRATTEQFEKERQLEYAKKVESFKFEKEREFVEELRKARVEIERAYEEKIKSRTMPLHLVETDSALASDWEMETIEKLRLENKELEEARDALLQQLRESRQKQQDMEDILDLVGATPGTPRDLGTFDHDPILSPPTKDIPLKDAHGLPPDFLPETDYLDPLSAEPRSDSQDEWKHDSSELEDALRISEELSGFALPVSGEESGFTRTVPCHSPSGDEDSLECDYRSKFNQLQSDHDELLVKANDLEEQVLKMSPIKAASSSSINDSDTLSRVVDLEMEREMLEQKIREQREIFSLEKGELQQRCGSLTLELENLNLFKENLEQELESMSYTLGKKSKGMPSVKTTLVTTNTANAFTQTDSSSYQPIVIEPPSIWENTGDAELADKDVLGARVTQLVERSVQYEGVITDLKQQISSMKSSNVLQELTEEVSEQDKMQEELLREVKRANEENERLRAFITNLETRFTFTEKKSRTGAKENSDDGNGRSTDSLEPNAAAKPANDNEGGHFVAGILDEAGWDVDWDKAARQSLDSLEGRPGETSKEDEDNRSPDSLDDVSSLCDQITSDVSSDFPALLPKQDAATETILNSTMDGFEPDASWTSDRVPLLQEKVYQLEMEKILLKAKVSKLEEELQKLKDVGDAPPKEQSQRVSSWVWHSDPNSSSDTNERGRRLVPESSSMVESSSTLTSNSGGSVENLLDARFREKTAVRYPTVNMNRETSDSPSPARESSSFPSVFEESGSGQEDRETPDQRSSSSSRGPLSLTDELADLSKEMKETQDIYVREKALLQEALDREQVNKEGVAMKMDSYVEEEAGEPDVMQLKQKLALAQQANKFLVRENEEWIVRVKQQEALIFQLRERLDEESSISGDGQNVLDQQLAMLHDHRNELLDKLDEKLSSEKLLSQVIGEKSVLEENLRVEKEILAEKMIERNILESELLDQKVELERIIQDQRLLEEKLYQKDKTEKQLMRQKRMLEEELYEIETKLREREAQLELEKSRLLRELKEKDLTIKRFEARRHSASVLSGHSSPRMSGSLTSLSVASSGSSASRSEPEKIRQMERVRQEMELKHRDAVDILRHQMTVDHSIEELRLRERHTTDLAALHQRNKQQLDSVKSHYEGVIEELHRQVVKQQPRPDTAMEGSGEDEGQSLLQHHQSLQMVETLKGSLSTGQCAELDTLLTSLDTRHIQQMETLRHQHSEDVILQLQAMRISVEQVESSRCQMLREELDRDRLAQLANQREELSAEYSEKIQALERNWSDRMDKLQADIGAGTTPDLASPPSSGVLLRQLEKQLHQEHNLLLQKLTKDPGLLDLEREKTDDEKTELSPNKENHVTEQVSAEDMLKLCSKMAAEYERLESLSSQLEIAVTRAPDSQLNKSAVSEKTESDADISAAWEVEIEDSQDYSMSDHGQFTDDILRTDERVTAVEAAQQATVSSEKDTSELQKKIDSLQSRLTEFELLKEELEESDKQVKELVAIVNAKDEVLTQLEEQGEAGKLVSELQSKLSVATKKVTTLEDHVSAKENENLELSDKLDAQQRLYTELEDICKSQESSLAEERRKVDNLVCDIKEKDTRLETLEQRLGLSSCDRTESEPQSVDTSLDESHDETSRVLRDTELRHAEEMEEMTQMHNEERDKLRENLKAARAKEMELSDQIEEMLFQHGQSLTNLREDLDHERKREVETMQSEFKVQMDVEVKRVTAELSAKHEEEVGKVHSEYKAKLKESAKENITNGDSDLDSASEKNPSLDKVRETVRQELTKLHDNAIRQLTLEWEEKVEKTRLELEEQWEDEKAEMDRKQKQEVSNLQIQLKDTQDKLSSIVEALDCGDFAAPALQEYRASLQEKVDLELEMARRLLQEEYEEQRSSLEEYTAEEAAHEQKKFIEQHQKMMDDFIAEREKKKENMEKQHAEALAALEARLRSAEVEGESSPRQEQEVTLKNEGSEVRRLENQLAEIKDSHKTELEEKEAQMNDKLTQMETQYQKEISELKTDYEAKLQTVKEDLTSSHTDQLEAVTMDTDKLQSDLDKAHQQELDDLEDRLTEKHRKELGNLEKQLTSKMEDMTEAHNEEISRLTKQHKSEIVRLQEELSKDGQEDEGPEPTEVVEELSAVLERSNLTEYTATESDIEIEYESSFIEEDEDREGSERDDDGRTTPAQMIQTLGFEEASKLADLATVTPPDDRVTAPDQDISGVSEEIEEDLERSALSELDQVLEQNTTGGSESPVTGGRDSPVTGGRDGQVKASEAVRLQTSVKPLSRSQDSSPRVNPRILQLEAEVRQLGTELEGKRGEAEWLQRQLVQQSAQYQELRVRLLNYEQLDGDSLVNMLRADTDRLGQERDVIQRANEHLLHLLSNSLKTYLSTEDSINKSLARVVSSAKSSPGQSAGLEESEPRSVDQSNPRESVDSSEGAVGNVRGQIRDGAGDRAVSPDNGNSKHDTEDKDRDTLSSEAGQNTSMMSMATDEGLDLSNRVTESIFMGPDIDHEGEELLRDGSSRLQAAVLRLLDMIGEGNEQLLEAQRIQQELLDTIDVKTDEAAQLAERLREEGEAKTYLASELNKAEGLLEGYEAEKSALQRRLEETEERVLVLVMDLESANHKLHELETSRGEVDEMRQEVARQQVALEANLGTENQDPTSEASGDTEYVEEPALMHEINKLSQEKRDISRQRDKDGERTTARIRDLEMTTEEMEKRYEDMLEEKKREIDELNLRVESLDNKLKSNRQFLDEQANDREQEREDHQLEVKRLNKVIQEKEKRENAQSRLQREVDDLTEEIQIKGDILNETTLRNEQLQRDLKEKHLRTQDLEDQVRHLEREIEEKAAMERAFQQKIARLEEELKQDSSASEDTGEGKPAGEHALQQRISSLEQELESRERTIYTERDSLEEELRKARIIEEELTNDKEALQRQVYENLHQISQLKTQLDEFKHRFDGGPAEHVDELKRQLEEEREAVERKEKEVSELVSQVEQFREQALDGDEQVQQLTAQLKVTEQQLEVIRSEQNSALKELLDENSQLKKQVKWQRAERDPSLQHSLLEEKNEEIDHLSQEIEKLRSEQTLSEDAAAMKELLTSMRQDLEQKSQQIEELHQTVDSLQHNDLLLDTTVSDDREPPLMPSLTERMSIQDEFSNALTMKDEEVLALQQELELKQSELSQAKIELETSVRLETSVLHDAALLEKDTALGQMTEQLESLQQEVSNLTDFQAKLQEDYDMVQAMLEDKQREIESLTKELTETRPQAEGATDALMKFELQVEALNKQLKEKDNVIDEKEEELYIVNEKLEEKESDVNELQKLIEEKEEQLTLLQKRGESDDQGEVTKLRETITEQELSLEELRQKLGDQGSEQEEALGVLRSQLEIAAKALEERDSQVERLTQALGGEDRTDDADGIDSHDQILSLKEKLQESEKERESLEEDKEYLSREVEAMRQQLEKHRLEALSHQTEASQRHEEVETLRQQLAVVQREAERIDQLTEELNRTRSQLQVNQANNSVLSHDSGDQEEVDRLKEELHKAQTELDVFRESAGQSAAELEKKIENMRNELVREHSENMNALKEDAERQTDAKLAQLSRQHEQELRQLRENHQKEVETSVRQSRREAEKEFAEERNLLLQRHRRELDTLQAKLTASEDVSVMDIHRQLQSEVAASERLDSRLLEHLSRPRQDGVGHDNPDVPYLEPSQDPSAGETIPDRLRVLMDRLHNEGVQMLTLSELEFLKRHSSPPRVEKEADLAALQAAWENEKQGLLSAVQALKDLLAQVHTNRQTEQMGEVGVSDWRNDLVTAISKVFAKERESLLAELRTHVVASPSTELSSLQRLEQKIRDQGEHHKSSMDQMYSVDRQSLLAEIRDLRSHASITRLQLQEEKQRLSQQLSSTEEQLSKREHHLKRQQLLEYKLKQEQVLQEDLRVSLEAETTRNTELQALASKEHQATLDLQMELSESHSQIDKLNDSLQQEETRVKSVSDAIEAEREKRNQLADQLEEERAETRRLKRIADEEKRRAGHLEEKEATLLQTLQLELEKEKALHAEVTGSLERERLSVDNLQRELQFEKDNLHAVENQFKSRLAQLQAHLHTEKARCNELHSAIEREQLLNEQLRNSLEEERGSVQATTQREQAIISDLKALLQTERGRVEELQSAAELGRRHVTSLNTALEEAKLLAGQELERERKTCRELKRQMDLAREQVLQLSRQHEGDEAKISLLHREHDDLKSEVKSLKDLENEREKRRESERRTDVQRLREVEKARDQANVKLHESELEIQRLRQKIADLDLHMQKSQTSLRVASLVHQATSPRTSDSVDGEVSGLSEFRERLDRYQSQLETSRQRLYLLLMRHLEELDSLSPRDASPRRKSLNNLLTEVQQLHRPLALETEARPTIAGCPSVTAINNRVTAHNVELTDFVARLSKEKAELRSNLGKLEEELWQRRRREAELEQLRGRTDITESMLVAERASWTQERLTLQMSLEHAEREVERLKGDLRAEQHRALRLTHSYSSESDTDKMNRLYGRYLRSESFRKALIYQKKYLLLLLGGFRDCEETTLAIIAQMGVYPSQEDVQRRSRHSKAFSTFRTAARVVVAIHRMQYLVKKWRRATKVGSPVVTGNKNLQHGYLSTANTFSPPRMSSRSQLSIQESPAYPPTDPHHVKSAYYTTYSPRSASPSNPSLTASTPPTRDKTHRLSAGDRPDNATATRRRLLSDLTSNGDDREKVASLRLGWSDGSHNGQLTDPSDQSLHEDYISRLENLQQRLGGLNDPGNLRTKPHWSTSRK